MTDQTKRMLKMQVSKGRYFYLPCDKAHEILEALKSSLNCSYTITDLNASDRLKIDGIMFRRNTKKA